MTLNQIDKLIRKARGLYEPYKRHAESGKMDAPPEWHAWKDFLVDEDGGEELFLALVELRVRLGYTGKARE